MTSPVRQLYGPQLDSTLTSLILVDIFSQQKLDPGKEFQNFAHGIVSYFLLFLLMSRVLNILFRSSSTSMMERPCGLWIMSGVSIPQSYRTMMPMKTKTSNWKMF